MAEGKSERHQGLCDRDSDGSQGLWRANHNNRNSVRSDPTREDGSRESQLPLARYYPGHWNACPGGVGAEMNTGIIPRSEWNAQPPKKSPTPRKHTNFIVIHHSGSPTIKEYFGAPSIAAIQNFHFKRGWSDIGYHYLISPDGKTFEGRAEDVSGAQCKGHNHESIGICVIGNYQTEEITRDSWAALNNLIQDILRRHPQLKQGDIKGHRDFDKTDCPGDALYHKLSVLNYLV